MMASSQLKAIVVSCLSSIPVALSQANEFRNPQGSQYILYSGTIGSSTIWAPDVIPPGTSGDCFNWTSPSYARTSLYVGVNPPWDPNPFFFELYHFASDCDSSFCFTTDGIYNLDFNSAAYQCYSGNDPCSFVEYYYHYEPKIYLDLKSKSKIQRLDIAGQTGYKVDGGPDSWVGNDNLNGVYTGASCYWVTPGDHVAGYTWIDFQW
jgi:hypothetical protein